MSADESLSIASDEFRRQRSTPSRLVKVPAGHTRSPQTASPDVGALFNELDNSSRRMKVERAGSLSTIGIRKGTGDDEDLSSEMIFVLERLGGRCPPTMSSPVAKEGRGTPKQPQAKEVSSSTIPPEAMSLDDDEDVKTQLTSPSSADDAVTIADIANDTVVVAQIPTDSVIVADITNGAVPVANIANDAVMVADLASDAVGLADIANDTVMVADIAKDNIVVADIANDAIKGDDIANDAGNLADIVNDVGKFTGNDRKRTRAKVAKVLRAPWLPQKSPLGKSGPKSRQNSMSRRFEQHSCPNCIHRRFYEFPRRRLERALLDAVRHGVSAETLMRFLKEDPGCRSLPDLIARIAQLQHKVPGAGHHDDDTPLPVRA